MTLRIDVDLYVAFAFRYQRLRQENLQDISWTWT
jgi:hypothetical protein